jgi:tetratricopeptide (TPR) repeat protein
VDALRGQLARARALDEAGKPAEGLPVARAALDEALRLRYRPVEAEARFALGLLENGAGDAAASVATLREAALSAEAARYDELGVRARIALVTAAAWRMTQFPDADRWVTEAAAKIERLGSSETLRAELESAHTMLLWREGRYLEALDEGERALALVGRVLGPSHPEAEKLIGHLANVYEEQGSYEPALVRFRRVLALREKRLGPDHPQVADSLNDVAIVEADQGRFDLARRDFGRALAIRERAFGPDHVRVLSTVGNLGLVEREEHKYAEAQASFERVLAVLDKIAPDSPESSAAHINLASLLLDEKHYPAALDHFQRALASDERRLGSEHPELSEPLTGIAQVYLRLGRAREAVPLLERAITLLEAQKSDSSALATARFELARALSARRGTDANPARARALAEAARAFLSEKASTPLEKDFLKTITRWLASH